MVSDTGAKALAIIAPNAASMAGCCAAMCGCCAGGWKECCKTDKKCPCCPIALWHLAVFGANCSMGYGSYLMWKHLRCFSCPEHCVYSLFVLSNAFQPCLLKKCEKWGCAPAVVNSLCSVGLAVGATHLFFANGPRRAGYYMIPGVVLALLFAGCTLACAHKRCCGKSEDSCCSGGACPCKK